MHHRHLLLLLAALAACSSDPNDATSELDAEGELLAAASELPPPPAPTLALENKGIVLGVTNRLRVTGIDPGDTVYLLRSIGTGNGPTCFASPAICVNLPGPARTIRTISTAVADASGTVFLNVPAPPTAPGQVYKVQAVADPNGAYEVSNVVTVRWLAQNLDTDGDGLVNLEEVTNNTNPENRDTDNGGASDGAEVLAGTNPLDGTDDPEDNDNDGYFTPTDCNDANPNVRPGAQEVCDGSDNDCNGVSDGADAWWDPAWPYRIPVVVDAPAWNTTGAPVAVDIDFRAALDGLADGAALDLNSIRVVRQDCSLGNPELPSEFIDGVANIFDKAPLADPTGDEHGAVAFEVDRDGDYTTDEIFTAGGQATFAIYFGSTAASPAAPAPAYTSGLVASSDGAVSELSNDLTFSTYRKVDAALQPVGGMADWIGPQGGPNVGKMSGTGLGQALYVNNPGGGPSGLWLSARGDGNASLSLVHAGPVFAAVRSAGTRATSATYPVQAGFDYEYTYYMFAGRPEIYTKVYYEINKNGTNVGPQGAAWTAAVRPFVVDNLASVGGTGSEGSREVPDFGWVRGTYATGSAAPFGLAAGYRNSVLQRGSPIFQADGRWVGLSGQDAEFAPTTVERQFNAGDVIVDHSIIAVYPHTGLFGSVSVDFYGIIEGVSPTVLAAEAL
jgi:hypothetical protein